MDTPPLDKSVNRSKTHSRNVSHNRIDLPRRNTRDPLLSGDDPLTGSIAVPAAEEPKPTPQPDASPEIPSILAEPPRDLSFLLVPENFHTLDTQDVPPPFRQNPDPSTSITELLEKGLFRAAAHSAVSQLTQDTPPPQEDIFRLLYIRLTCLCLLNQTTLAGQESRCLQDLTSPFWVSESTKKNIVPWELRVLATRLQAIGMADVRRAVTGYYDLARSARAQIQTAKDDDERQLWTTRLFDLGVRVANVLIEIGDYGAAARHLATLEIPGALEEQNELIRGRLGLLYLRIGRIGDARRYIVGDEAAGSYAEMLRPLLSVIEGNYGSSAKQLGATATQDVLTKSNMAVSLVYAGEMKKAREVLETMVSDGETFPLLLFNLSTIFELCTERSRSLKMRLVEEVAQLQGGVQGWERSMVDFKL